MKRTDLLIGKRSSILARKICEQCGGDAVGEEAGARNAQVKAKDRALLKWTKEAMEAYEESKRLVLRAVAL